MATLVGAGCGVGGEAPLDIDAVERQIPTVLLPGHPDLVTEVDCGSPDPEGLGPLSCTALVADTPVPVHVNRPGIDGRVRVRSPIEVVVAVDLATRVAERESASTREVSATLKVFCCWVFGSVPQKKIGARLGSRVVFLKKQFLRYRLF